MKNTEEKYKYIYFNTEKMCAIHKISIPEIKYKKVSFKIDLLFSNQIFFKIKYEWKYNKFLYYPLLDNFVPRVNSRFKQDTINLTNAVENILN